MLDFVKRAFREFYSIILWFTLISSIVLGGIVGYGIGYAGGAFIGIILGGLLGLVFIIITGGIIATFINIDDNLEEIAKVIKSKYSNNKIDYTNISPSNILPSIDPSNSFKTCDKCGQNVNEDIFKCPKCGNESFKP